MNRRGFLRAMLAAGAAPAIVKAANIMPVFARLDSGLLAPRYMDDLVRETFAYDMGFDCIYARYDILYGYTQVSVDQRFATTADARKFGAKNLAVELFDNELRHKGLSWRDVRPWPWVDA